MARDFFTRSYQFKRSIIEYTFLLFASILLYHGFIYALQGSLTDKCDHVFQTHLYFACIAYESSGMGHQVLADYVTAYKLYFV